MNGSGKILLLTIVSISIFFLILSARSFLIKVIGESAVEGIIILSSICAGGSVFAGIIQSLFIDNH